MPEDDSLAGRDVVHPVPLLVGGSETGTLKLKNLTPKEFSIGVVGDQESEAADQNECQDAHGF